MSKLFDTLEQIRENEEAAPRKTAPKSTREPRKGGPRPAVVVFVVLVGILCVTLLYVDFSIFQGQPPPPDSQVTSASREPSQPGPTAPDSAPHPVADISSTPAATPDTWQEILAAPSIDPGQKAILLNNIATRHIQEQEYWKGISILEHALKLSPDSPEILINYGVALTELDILEVAALYFEEAYRINPGHPALIRNIAILKQNTLMGEKLMSLYGQ